MQGDGPLDSAELGESIFEHATVGIFVIRVGEDRRFRFESWNPVTERLVGKSRADAHGRLPEDFLPAAEAARVNAHYRRCVEAGTPITYEEEPIDITPARVFSTTLIPIRDPDGRIHLLLGLSQDISEQKQAERALRASEEKFGKAFSLSPLAIGVTEYESSRILELNEAFERTFEVPRAQAIGRTWAELGFWQDLAERQRMVDHVRTHGFVRNFTAHVRSFTGRQLRLLLSSTYFSFAGAPYVITFAHDMTEHDQQEDAKAALEAQLREAQKLEALGTLAGGIAHDFNNILGAIVAYTDLMGMEIDDPTALRGHLGELRRASDRARDLVRQILTFSRHQKPERRPVRLEQPVREALQLLRATLPATIAIDSQLDADVPMVLADPSQIHQIVMNLATNAAHALRDRPGKITLTLEAVTVDAALSRSRNDLREGHSARLRVSDDGCGMDAPTLARIFDPFFTTKAQGEGTGLGLAVVHGIVRDHEGAIAVQSQLGLGTSFELYFPEHAAELSGEIELAAAPLRGRGEHLLLVDDEHALRTSAGRLLERFGYRVTACGSPVEALAAFRKDPRAFDLVLADLTMPGMTGIEMAREMLALAPATRITIMSGYSATWTQEALRAQGIQGLLVKPIGAQALWAAVRATLDAREPLAVAG